MVIAQPKPMPRRAIRDFSPWMEAWNIYIAVIVAQDPARAALLLAYQRIICNATLHFPPAHWLKYDARFRACAAEDKSLRWDIKHNDLWLECFTHPATSSPQAPPSSIENQLLADLAHTVGPCTTSLTTARRTLFALIGDLQARNLLLSPSTPLLRTASSLTTHPPPHTKHASSTQTLAATSTTTKLHAHAHSASSTMPAPDVETATTGKNPAPGPSPTSLPINQHHTYTIARA